MTENTVKHLTAAEIATMTLEEANAVIAQRSEDFYHWPCTAEEITAWYEIGVRDFTYANLASANLYRANLESANLSDANLESANLESANLASAYLYRANMGNANLESANLSSAYLTSANLESANLASASLASASLTNINANYCERLWTISNIGSRNATLVAWHEDGILHLHTGCQQDISIETFRERLANSDADVREEYEDALQFLERRLMRLQSVQS